MPVKYRAIDTNVTFVIFFVLKRLNNSNWPEDINFDGLERMLAFDLPARITMLKYCRNCGKELALTPAKTCRECGAKPTRAVAFCRYCGHITTVNDAVCPTCGAAIKPLAGFTRFYQENPTLVKLGIVVNIFIVASLITTYIVLSLPKWVTRTIKSTAADVVMQSTGYNAQPLVTISVAPPLIPGYEGPKAALHAVNEDFTPEGVPVNTTHQLTVFALYKNNAAEDITKMVVYKSESEAIANVTAEGLVTAVGPGKTKIIILYTALPGSANSSNPAPGKVPVTLNASVPVTVY